jgi:signal transduction histidine kinase
MSGPGQNAMRVLIVDDNPLDRAEAKAALLNGSRRLYQFIEASSADEALRLCAQSPVPDCIILDLGLPDAEGLEALNRLPRDKNKLLDIPVVVLTASMELGLSQAALRAGAQDYVGKAWLRPETLTQAVENAIERLRMARALQAQRVLVDEARNKALTLESENRQIQEANRLKSQFLANMSHELRTPLTAIIGFADLLHMGAVPLTSPQHAVFLGHIGSSGRHLLRLINDVLDLSKIESGKFEFFPESFDLGVLVKQTLDILQTQVMSKHLRVVADIEASIQNLVLDPARLKQVLYNYLSNAIKFTPEGGQITLRARAAGAHHVRIEVEDTGIGIAPADLARLFTAYQQLDAGSTKKYEGAGLGLALTRRLVTAQGGSVGVQSRLGIGSVFHLVLNRIQGIDPAKSAADEDGLSTATDPRLLVIHDDRDDPPELVTGLAAAGFRVDVATSGQQAVQRACDSRYDAITLGLLLPDQCGLAVLQQMRDAGLNRESPVVCVTMRADAGAVASFAITDVLCKPIRSDEIVAAMARFRWPGASPTKVMVIDDDPLALDLMRATLKAIGIDAVCLLDGRDALRELDHHRPDAIILDLVMPEFDGFAVLHALQQMPAWSDTPVFVWTGLNLSDADYACLGRSARSVVSKRGGSMDATVDALRRWRPPGTWLSIADGGMA